MSAPELDRGGYKFNNSQTQQLAICGFHQSKEETGGRIFPHYCVRRMHFEHCLSWKSFLVRHGNGMPIQ